MKESKDRVPVPFSIHSLNLPPAASLGPADLPKEGGRFDLAIALGILAASQQIPCAPLSALSTGSWHFLGSYALSAPAYRLRLPVPSGRALIVPTNAPDAAL